LKKKKQNGKLNIGEKKWGNNSRPLKICYRIV